MKFFSNLQEAINHLDQAPIGFLSVNTQGTVLYANAIFAEWFSIDLANFTVGQYSFDQLFDSVGENSAWSDICLQNDRYQSSDYSSPYRFSLCLNAETGVKKILNCFMSASSLLEEDTIYRIVIIPQQVQRQENDDQVQLPNALVKYFYASPFAIAVVNEKGQCVHMNDAFSSLMGCADKTFDLYDIISHRDHVQLERAFQKITTNKNYTVSIETVLEKMKNAICVSISCLQSPIVMILYGILLLFLLWK